MYMLTYIHIAYMCTHGEHIYTYICIHTNALYLYQYMYIHTYSCRLSAVTFQKIQAVHTCTHSYTPIIDMFKHGHACIHTHKHTHIPIAGFRSYAYIYIQK